MSVYIDHAKNPFKTSKGTWFMNHMIADKRSELDEMAEALDLESRWKQKVGEQNEHYDVTETKRTDAVRLGAIQIGSKDLVRKLMARDLPYYLEH